MKERANGLFLDSSLERNICIQVEARFVPKKAYNEFKAWGEKIGSNYKDRV